MLKPATMSFCQGWQEVVTGQTRPVAKLWEEFEEDQIAKHLANAKEDDVPRTNRTDWFDLYLQLPTGELEWELARGSHFAPEDLDYLINPRRLRGSDFLMRWSQGRWSEDIVMRTLNQNNQFGVIPYGPSTVAPEDPKELELFFDRMDVIGREGKRPDLLLYDRLTLEQVKQELERRLGSVDKMAEVSSADVHDLIVKARVALEVENSLWATEKMPGFGKEFSRYTRGKNKGRLKPAGIIPTIIVKQEDAPRLQKWEADFGVPIYVVHIFFDRGYFIKFDDVLTLIESGEVGWETQHFTNPDGTASSPKQIVKVPYTLCKDFGLVSGQTLEPHAFVDKNGKVMTYVAFEGGKIELAPTAFEEWAA